MQVVDPGHEFLLDVFDGVENEAFLLHFVKREGPGYPFNVGASPGTNCQEVIRALISRVKYLDRQIPAAENDIILDCLRSALVAFEIRAARRHGRELPLFYGLIENQVACRICGHIGEHTHATP